MMNSLQNILSANISLFKHQIFKPLSDLQRKVACVALAIFSVLAAVSYYRFCYHVKKAESLVDSTGKSPSLGVADKVTSLLQEEVKVGKQKALEILEKAFDELRSIDPKNKEYAPLYVTILSRYGERLHPQFEKALPYLLSSLQLQLQAHGLLEKENEGRIASIKEIQMHASLDKLILLFKTADENTYSNLVKDLTDEEKLQFAQTLFALGGVYSNLKEKHLKMDKASYLACITHLYQGIKEIFISLEQAPMILEKLGELHYHIYPGLYLEKCEFKNEGKVSKEELEESLRMLDEARNYNSSLPMQARIANLKACNIYEYLQDLTLAKQYAQESLEVWEKVFKDQTYISPDQQEEYGTLCCNREQQLSEPIDKIREAHSRRIGTICQSLSRIFSES